MGHIWPEHPKRGGLSRNISLGSRNDAEYGVKESQIIKSAKEVCRGTRGNQKVNTGKGGKDLNSEKRREQGKRIASESFQENELVFYLKGNRDGEL